MFSVTPRGQVARAIGGAREMQGARRRPAKTKARVIYQTEISRVTKTAGAEKTPIVFKCFSVRTENKASYLCRSPPCCANRPLSIRCASRSWRSICCDYIIESNWHEKSHTES